MRSTLRRPVPVLYKISTLVDASIRADLSYVPVLYKISTLVDSSLEAAKRGFPFFTKFLLL